MSNKRPLGIILGILSNGQFKVPEIFRTGIMHKPDVDSIKGSSPAISVEQKTTSKNPGSTVGTIITSLDFSRDFAYKMSTKHYQIHYLRIGDTTQSRSAPFTKIILK